MISDAALRSSGVNNLLHGFELNPCPLGEAHPFAGSRHIDVDNQIVGELGSGSRTKITEVENIYS
jgi:hypothetical protein